MHFDQEGPHQMDEQRQDDQLEPIYNSSVPIQDVALKMMIYVLLHLVVCEIILTAHVPRELPHSALPTPLTKKDKGFVYCWDALEGEC